MLGLGHSLSSHTPTEGTANNDVTYTSDFSSGVDSFQAIYDNSPSAATLTGNQDFDGKTDVLKISWSAAEADGLFYAKRAMSGFSGETDYAAQFSCDVYYDFDGSTSVATIVHAGNPASGSTNMYDQELTTGQWHTISGDIYNTDTTSDGNLYIGFLDTDDKPLSGDNMYIANVSFTFTDNN
jgi:hypothetical protein